MALTYAQQVIADGASNYWRLNETAGLVAVDSIGGANGTISGGVTLNQPGVTAASKSMTFDGTTGKIALPILAGLSGASAWSVEVWARRGDLVATCMALQFGDTNNYLQHANNGQWTLSGNISGTTRTTTAPALSDLQWHAVVGVGDGATLRIYIDGVQVIFNSNAPGALTTASGEYRIGAYGAGILFWNGQLQDVAVYPLVLAPAQIAAHYAAQLAPPGAFTGRGPIANLRGKVTATHALDVSTTVALADAARTGHLDGPTHSTDAILIPAPAADEQVIVTGLSASVLVAGPFAVTYRTGPTAVLGPIWLPSSGAAALVTGRTFDTGPIVRALPPGQGLTVTTTVDAPQSFEATYEIVSVG